MNTAAQVDLYVSQWKQAGMEKAQIVVNTCEAELGWPYVWGASGQECNPTKRRYFAGRSSCPEGESKLILSRCQVCNGSKSACNGCAYYPNNERVLIDDCQGFDKQVFKRVGITLSGGGATSMYNNNSNWTTKGKIQDMPKNVVCCVFMQDGSKMKHTGVHIGNGDIIHCSGTVKRGKTTDRGWTHYAIPKGIDGYCPPDYPTIKKGSRGEYVKLAQEELLKRGYDVGASGADGIFGDATKAAVLRFQKDWGLAEDGIIGPATWSMLLSAPVIEKMYTVRIPHLTLEEAANISSQYPGSTVEEEVRT